MDHRQNWERLENLLQTALDHEQSRLPSEDVSNIRRFIDHGEYGLAWEELTAALSELNLVPNERTKKTMQEAASLMYPDGR
ncbi:MafI family immunity protein [Inquilinus limosus]|uniref:MafI family immunity protein n=1 Tax=Inquilinus limosus TaxID=171674 RepID=UPI003F13CDE2